jgi:uncharacterized protein YhhL (DUF1145 family)
MSAGKIALLLLYAVLAFLALTQPGSPAGVWSLRIILVLVVAHVVEVIVFYKTCQRAGGSLAGHLINVFLFGVVHVREIRNT